MFNDPMCSIVLYLGKVCDPSCSFLLVVYGRNKTKYSQYDAVGGSMDSFQGMCGGSG